MRALCVFWIVVAGCKKQETNAAPAASSSAPAASACPSGMVFTPGGAFTMGTDSGEPIERPPHRVEVASFCMDETEVTVEAYAACSSCSPAGRAVDWPDITDAERALWSPFCNAGRAGRERHPVNCVDWEQAAAYCKAQGKRLPTEQEFEYAARGGSEQRTFPWGEEAPSARRLNGCGKECAAMLAARGKAWEAMYPQDDGFPDTAPVKSFPAGASRWGVHDIAGNVWEWIADRHCPYPSGECAETKRNDRGGGWLSANASSFQGAHRHGCVPSQRVHNLGLRCVK